MVKINLLLKHKDQIINEGTKYGYNNLAISASEDNLNDFPYQFLAEKGEINPTAENFNKFKQYLEDILEDKGVTITYKSTLKEMISRNKEIYGHLQYSLNSAIDLTELTEEPFIEQFDKRIRVAKSLLEPSSDSKDISLNVSSPKYHQLTKRAKLSLEREKLMEFKVQEIIDLFSDPNELEHFKNKLSHSLKQKTMQQDTPSL